MKFAPPWEQRKRRQEAKRDADYRIATSRYRYNDELCEYLLPHDEHVKAWRMFGFPNWLEAMNRAFANQLSDANAHPAYCKGEE